MADVAWDLSLIEYSDGLAKDTFAEVPFESMEAHFVPGIGLFCVLFDGNRILIPNTFFRFGFRPPLWDTATLGLTSVRFLAEDFVRMGYGWMPNLWVQKVASGELEFVEHCVTGTESNFRPSSFPWVNSNFESNSMEKAGNQNGLIRG